MHVKDIMSNKLVSISPDTSIAEAISLMIRNHVSGLPVVDENQNLVGIISESDFMRRLEMGTLRRRHWLDWLLSPEELAGEYARTRGQRVGEVMTDEVQTIQEDADVAQVVEMMQTHSIKRLPVLRGEDLVGIVTRSDLMRALASFVAGSYEDTIHTDDEIRAAVTAEMNAQAWAPIGSVGVDVDDGVVTFVGGIADSRQRDALRAIAENVAGVKAVDDHLLQCERPAGYI